MVAKTWGRIRKITNKVVKIIVVKTTSKTVKIIMVTALQNINIRGQVVVMLKLIVVKITKVKVVMGKITQAKVVKVDIKMRKIQSLMVIEEETVRIAMIEVITICMRTGIEVFMDMHRTTT